MFSYQSKQKLLLLKVVAILLLVSCYAHAAFVPPRQADLAIWLKADGDVTKDGGNNVSSWNDESGNGNHATANKTKPLWVEGVVNGGWPVIRFSSGADATATLLQTDRHALGRLSDMTVFVVAAHRSVVEGSTILGSKAGPYGTAGQGEYSVGTGYFAIDVNDSKNRVTFGESTIWGPGWAGQTGGVDNVFNGIADTSFHIQNVLFDGYVKDGANFNFDSIIDLYVDGSNVQVENTVSAGVGATEGLDIGGIESAGSYSSYDVDVAEILVYMGAGPLSTEDRDLVIDYLNTKYFLWTSPCGNPVYLESDLNTDCIVNFKDLAELALQWQQCTDPAGCP